MIYQPSNAYPNNVAIDGERNNEFSWTFNGDMLVGASIMVTELYSSPIYQQTFNADTNGIYGGDTVTCPVNFGLENGKDYLWKITQREQNPTMFVKRGNIVSASSTTSVTLVNDGAVWFNTGCYFVYKGQYSHITAINPSGGNMVLTLQTPLSTTPSAGDDYQIYTDTSVTINGFYFKARSTPVVTINRPSSDYFDIDGNIRYRRIDLTASYTQAENISIKYHNWTLADSTGGILDSTNDIYNSRLKYSFDGLTSGTNYIITLNVVTQEDQSVSTSYSFHVQYNEPLLSDVATVSWNSEHNSVNINCKVIRFSVPRVDGTYEFVDPDTLHIISGNIVYDNVSGNPLELTDFTLFSSLYFEPGKLNNVIALLTNTYDVNTIGDSYYVSVDGWALEDGTPSAKYLRQHMLINRTDVVNEIVALTRGAKECLRPSRIIDDRYEYIWTDNMTFDLLGNQYFVMNENISTDMVKYKIVMTPTKFYVRNENGLNMEFDVNTQGTVFKALCLYKDVYYDYNILLNRTATDDEINDFFGDDFSPTFDTFEDTIIFTPFNNTLVSSDVEGITSDLIGYQIYRREVGESILHNVGFIPLDAGYIEDFMVCNNKAYTWLIVPTSDTEFGVSIETPQLFIRFDEWTVVSFEPDVDAGEDFYTADEIWKFGLNIEPDNLQQNILKTKFESLSRYPKYTVQERNYISGGLTCYITNMIVNDIKNNQTIQSYFPYWSPYRSNNCIYYEPADMLLRWNELVASGKEVLIRDLKGHIFKAQIDENSAKIDVYSQVAPTTISFTFTEVGSSSDMSVYLKGVATT